MFCLPLHPADSCRQGRRLSADRCCCRNSALLLCSLSGRLITRAFCFAQLQTLKDDMSVPTPVAQPSADPASGVRELRP